MLGRFCKSYILTISQNGSLAQLVEQRTLNPFVAGSIPARPTNIINALRLNSVGHFYLWDAVCGIAGNYVSRVTCTLTRILAVSCPIKLPETGGTVSESRATATAICRLPVTSPDRRIEILSIPCRASKSQPRHELLHCLLPWRGHEGIH